MAMKNPIKAKKTLSQHFLRDSHVLAKILEYSNLTTSDTVLEIGAGNGVLTEHLCRHASKVIAIEKDRALVENFLLPLTKKYNNLEIIAGDVLKIEMPECTKIVANLPYAISTQITFKILEHRFSLAILMYQREFAERMVAKPDTENYSKLSVNVYVHALCEILQYVSRGAFWPVPNVDSAIVRIVPRIKPPFQVEDWTLFHKLVDVAFQHRRKKMGTIIRTYFKNEKCIELLKSHGYYDKRPENLSPEDFGRIADWLVQGIIDNSLPALQPSW
jgi:16S rRNA (adenine1518-N6/adenine1519-N6)-dimethyltransferase